MKPVALRCLLLAMLMIGCGKPGETSYAVTLGKACASAHDCGANQKCRGKVCELDQGACLSAQDCGSRRCETGYCALPAPVLLTGDSTRNRSRATPAEYLAAGRDGLVDARGGLVLQMADKLNISPPEIHWGAWKLAYWKAQSADPKTWTVTRSDPNDAPERFVFVHPEGAKLVAYVRPLLMQDRNEKVAPLKLHLERILAALERGASFEDALALSALGSGSYPLERGSTKAASLGQLEAVRYEGLRNIPNGGEKLRFFVARLNYGDTEFFAVCGLAAPIDAFTTRLPDLDDFLTLIRFAGIDAKVGQ